jgi:hypothetical protein
VSCDLFGPEDSMGNCRPFSLLSVTYFHNCFPSI